MSAGRQIGFAGCNKERNQKLGRDQHFQHHRWVPDLGSLSPSCPHCPRGTCWGACVLPLHNPPVTGVWKGAGTRCSDKAAPFPWSRCLPKHPTGLHNYRAERLQPVPLLGGSYCVLLLMRFLVCFLSLCHTLWAQHSKIVLFLHAADPKQENKSVLFEFHFPGLVLLVPRCNWALAL